MSIPVDYAASPPRSRRRGTFALAGLTTAITVMAGVLLWQGAATRLEAISVVTGAVCVWLTVRENIWNFPIGMLNVATFAVVFFRARLMSDAGLQIVYFILGAIGWYLWLYGGKGRTTLQVTRVPARRGAGVTLAIVLMWAGLFWLNHRIGGASPFWDALTTAISLGAQWLLDRKHLENWLLWIAVDIIYVPLYLYKQLYLTSLLYAVFLCMAVMGLMQWRRTFRDLHRMPA